jgi:hypothetical protein
MKSINPAKLPDNITLIKSGVRHPNGGLPVWDLCRSDAGNYTTCEAGAHRSCPPEFGRSIHLQELVRSSSLTRQQIADKLGVPKRTLDAWMQPYGSKEHRNPSEAVLRLAQIVVSN